MHRLKPISLVFLFALFLAGCTSTRGTRVEGLEKREPYRFQYAGDRGDALEEIKRVLVPEGWNLRNEDVGAGVISAQKTLRKDEKISQTAFGEAMTESMAGVSTSGQKGRLSFLLTSEGDNTVVEMTPELVVVIKESSGFESSKSEKTSTPRQGHPMVVKYGLALHRTEGFELKQPSPSLLVRAEKKSER